MWRFWSNVRHTNSRHLTALLQPSTHPILLDRFRLLHCLQFRIDGRPSGINHRHFATRTRNEIDLTSPQDPTLSDAQRRTIYALSTPPGKAGVAVVRISGPDALLVWKRMVRIHGGKHKRCSPEPWKMERCRIIQPEKGGEALDDGLAVYFRGAYIQHLYRILKLTARLAFLRSSIVH
jgi:hypothetical protein